MSKIDHQLFTAHEHALEKEYERCPKCGASLLMRHSGNAHFWGCENYPSCDFTRPIAGQEHRIEKQLDMACPKCDKPLALKQGRYGLFVGCTGFPACDYHTQIDQTDDTGVACPKCKEGKLVERTSRYGKHFYACSGYPKCQFAVNYPPKAGTCIHCGFELLVERKMASGPQLRCASKRCGKKQ